MHEKKMKRKLIWSLITVVAVFAGAALAAHFEGRRFPTRAWSALDIVDFDKLHQHWCDELSLSKDQLPMQQVNPGDRQFVVTEPGILGRWTYTYLADDESSAKYMLRLHVKYECHFCPWITRSDRWDR